MRIGVFSDVHDNLKGLESMIQRFEREGIEEAVFCGDFCSPIPAIAMGESRLKIHAVFGNTDDRPKITKFADTKFPNLKIYQDSDPSELILPDGKIAFYHFPWPAQALARTGDYKAVFYGHTHQPKEERVGDCLFLNPGEIMQWKSGPECAIYDSESNSAEFISLRDIQA